ncbi:MAG: hypothetical protein PHD60_03070, partial [Clostridia bacterium]|nr:hypothetical protein [Clostridia bacterium]
GYYMGVNRISNASEDYLELYTKNLSDLNQFSRSLLEQRTQNFKHLMLYEIPYYPKEIALKKLNKFSISLIESFSYKQKTQLKTNYKNALQKIHQQQENKLINKAEAISAKKDLKLILNNENQRQIRTHEKGLISLETLHIINKSSLFIDPYLEKCTANYNSEVVSVIKEYRNSILRQLDKNFKIIAKVNPPAIDSTQIFVQLSEAPQQQNKYLEKNGETRGSDFCNFLPAHI